MFEYLDNRLSGCISLFVIGIISVWYMKPKFLFQYDYENGETVIKTKTLHIGSFEVNLFGVCAVVIAIFVYYLCALIQYS